MCNIFVSPAFVNETFSSKYSCPCYIKISIYRNYMYFDFITLICFYYTYSETLKYRCFITNDISLKKTPLKMFV